MVQSALSCMTLSMHRMRRVRRATALHRISPTKHIRRRMTGTGPATMAAQCF